MSFSVAPDLAAIVRAGVLHLEGATVIEHEHRLNAPLAAAEAAVRTVVSGRAGLADLSAGASAKAEGGPAEATSVRAMYKRVGLDPTKTRPSSEALLRRVRKGDTLPRINSMVDVCNWCSLEFQLPYGLYDASKIEGDVELRLGAEGESYAGIRKDDVHVNGRITLADRLGPFGNPTSDSARTMVTTGTTRALLVVFAPRDVDERRLTHVLDVTSARMAEFTGCSEIARSMS
jgi:DNA/RNA-binding domain of Phe-tRNA-synthetase-like protein